MLETPLGWVIGRVALLGEESRITLGGSLRSKKTASRFRSATCRASPLTAAAPSSHGAQRMATATRPLTPSERLDWLRLIRSENVGPIGMV